MDHTKLDAEITGSIFPGKPIFCMYEKVEV